VGVEKMGHVVIATVIGTVSLLVLCGIIGTYYTIYYASLEKDVLSGKLQDISNRVSSDISDLVALGSIIPDNQLLVKRLDIPNNINSKYYELKIVHTENSMIVMAQEFLRPSVYGEAYLPWSTNGSVSLYNGTNPGITNPRIIQKTVVNSIQTDLVIWYLKKDGIVTFGLGTEV
jgi:hypothetical protein